MRRTLLAVGFCFIPVCGQQVPSPLRANVRGFGRLAASGGETNFSPAAIAPSGTPTWTPFVQFTPHTGLDTPSAVYDPATNIMMVFGGADAGLSYEFTNAVLLRANANGSGDWSTLIANGAAGAPTARAGHTAVYDSVHNRMIGFGGCLGSFLSGCPTRSNEVWVLSGANGQGGTPIWTLLSPAGTPPAVRSAHTAVYDAANNRMTVFGGYNATQSFADVWVLSNANGLGGTPAWTKLSISGGPPNGIGNGTAVYDPVNNIMIVFGGINYASTAGTNAVWALSHANGLGGAPHWTNIVANGATGSPSRRLVHTAVYDVANNRMIIFGGSTFATTAFPGYNDVWVLANANGLGGTPVWTQLNPPGLKPGLRYDHAAAYDAVNNLMIIFSGINLDAQFYVTWVLSDANGL